MWVGEHARWTCVDPARSPSGRIGRRESRRRRHPAAQVAGLPLVLSLLVYPVNDYDLETRSYGSNADRLRPDPRRDGRVLEHYLGPNGDGVHPEASPLHPTDLAGLAPAFVLTVEPDPLRDEGEAYTGRLEEAGVPVTLSRYDGRSTSCGCMPGAILRATTGGRGGRALRRSHVDLVGPDLSGPRPVYVIGGADLSASTRLRDRVA